MPRQAKAEAARRASGARPGSEPFVNRLSQISAPPSSSRSPSSSSSSSARARAPYSRPGGLRAVEVRRQPHLLDRLQRVQEPARDAERRRKPPPGDGLPAAHGGGARYERWSLNEDAKRLGITVSDDELTNELVPGRRACLAPGRQIRQVGYALSLREDLTRYLDVRNRQTKKFDNKAVREANLNITKMSPTGLSAITSGRSHRRPDARASSGARVRVGENEAFEQFSRREVHRRIAFASRALRPASQRSHRGHARRRRSRPPGRQQQGRARQGLGGAEGAVLARVPRRPRARGRGEARGGRAGAGGGQGAAAKARIEGAVQRLKKGESLPTWPAPRERRAEHAARGGEPRMRPRAA